MAVVHKLGILLALLAACSFIILKLEALPPSCKPPHYQCLDVVKSTEYFDGSIAYQGKTPAGNFCYILERKN